MHFKDFFSSFRKKNTANFKTGKKSVLFNSVRIGDQTWMTENLNVDTYRNGDPIPEVKDADSWEDISKGAWCYYNNDPSIGNKYGKLYNWYAINDPRGLAPQGWHIPSKMEWLQLINTIANCKIPDDALNLPYFSIELMDATIKMKSTSAWKDDNGKNVKGSNESGFNAFPIGTRLVSSGPYYSPSRFDFIGECVYWWLSEASGSHSTATSIGIVLSGSLTIYGGGKNSGKSVRCIKD